MKEGVISIVIVNHNGRKFLPRLLKSIEKQTYQNFETIFIDDSSTDSSVRYVKKNYPKTRIYITENKGFGTACNIGAQNSKGRYLVFLNEDMYMPKDFLEKLILSYKKLKNSEKNIGGIGCKIIPFDSKPPDTSNYHGGRLDFMGFPNDNYNPDIPPFIINGCPFFIKKDLFLSVKGFNENIFLYGEDVDISWRLKIFGYNHHIANNIYLYHFGRGTAGDLSPEKIAFIIYASFIPMITNFSKGFLFIILPLYLIDIIFLNLILLIYTRFNFKCNYYLIKNYINCYKNLSSILKFRTFVQKNRKIKDSEIINNFDIIPSFLLNFYRKKLASKMGL